MRVTSDIKRLRLDPLYSDVFKIFKALLQQKQPDQEILTKIYGQNRGREAALMIEEYFGKHSDSNLRQRQHNAKAPEEIGKIRKKLERNTVFEKMHRQLLLGQIPPREGIEYFYGNYTDVVIQVFDEFQRYKLNRKCGIPTICHLNRVGAMAYEFGLNQQGSYEYSTIGVLHDVIEDLMFHARDENGRIFTLRKFQKFLEKYIPEALRDSVKLLTNHYDLIFNWCEYHARRQNITITKDNLLFFLRGVNKEEYFPVMPYIEEMIPLIESLQDNSSILGNARWMCYKNLYISGMAKKCHASENYRTYEIKAVDLTDNGIGREALSLSSRIKNIIKHLVWVEEGYALGASWAPLNNHIMELSENCLLHAEHIIIKDLLEPVYSLDFLSATLLKLERLKPVFYISAG